MQDKVSEDVVSELVVRLYCLPEQEQLNLFLKVISPKLKCKYEQLLDQPHLVDPQKENSL